MLVLAALASGCIAPIDEVHPNGPPAAPSAIPAVAASTRPAPSAPASSPTQPTPTPVPPIADRSDGFEPIDGPMPVVDPDRTSATIERDGVRVTIEIDRVPLVGGEPAWVTTTLVNTGRDMLRWTTDGCQIHVGIHGEMPLRWAAGFEQPGVGGKFKDWEFEADVPPPDEPIWLRFVPQRFLGIPEFGCADLGVPQQLRPAGRLIERSRWDGTTGIMGPTPSGPATLIAAFSSWSRRADAERSEPPIEVRLPVNVVGNRPPRMLSAGQAIDVALSDWGFRAFLEAHPEIPLWQRRIVALDPRTNRWLVVLGTDAGASATVSIDAETGEIVWSGTQAARAPEREPPIRTP